MKILTTIGAILFAVAGFISTAAAAAKVGDQAPDFELQGSDGQTHHLADYKDKQAVVLALVSESVHRRLHGRMQIDEGRRRRHPQVRRRLVHDQRRSPGW